MKKEEKNKQDFQIWKQLSRKAVVCVHTQRREGASAS